MVLRRPAGERLRCSLRDDTGTGGDEATRGERKEMKRGRYWIPVDRAVLGFVNDRFLITGDLKPGQPNQTEVTYSEGSIIGRRPKNHENASIDR